MSSIGDFNPVSQPSFPQHNAGSAFDLNEAKQMNYVLFLLFQIANFENRPSVAADISIKLNEFRTQMNQQPIPIKKMEQEMNEVIQNVNGASPRFMNILFPWNDQNMDQQKPGYSFMWFMLAFAQFLDGQSNQNPIIHQSVQDIDTFLHTEPWNVNKMESVLSQFFLEYKKLHDSGDSFPYIPPPPYTIFANRPLA